MAKTARGYRAQVVAELADEDRQEIEAWLSGQFDPAQVAAVTGPRLAVALCELVGRDAKELGHQLERLESLQRQPLALRPDAELEARPSRQRPRLFFLPFDAVGPLLIGAAAFDPFVGLGPMAATKNRARLFMLAGVTRGAIEPEIEAADGGWWVPRKWPESVPRPLRRRMDAVRLAVYPSQITSESRDLIPLTQVELPRAAAVR